MEARLLQSSLRVLLIKIENAGWVGGQRCERLAANGRMNAEHYNAKSEEQKNWSPIDYLTECIHSNSTYCRVRVFVIWNVIRTYNTVKQINRERPLLSSSLFSSIKCSPKLLPKLTLTKTSFSLTQDLFRYWKYWYQNYAALTHLRCASDINVLFTFKHHSFADLTKKNRPLGLNIDKLLHYASKCWSNVAALPRLTFAPTTSDDIEEMRDGIFSTLTRSQPNSATLPSVAAAEAHIIRHMACRMFVIDVSINMKMVLFLQLVLCIFYRKLLVGLTQGAHQRPPRFDTHLVQRLPRCEACREEKFCVNKPHSKIRKVERA